MGSTTEHKGPAGWLQRRSDRRARAAETAHAEVEAQLRKLSSQWRRGIVSHEAGLRPPLDLEHDNVRGGSEAKVTLVEYGDYESKTCIATAPVIRDLRRQFGADLRMAWRHFPIADAHPHAVGAAVAALAAGAQGHFWDMHDRLQYAEADYTGAIDRSPGALRTIAGGLDLDLDRYDADLAEGVHLTHVFEDFNSGVASGVNGCPTFFINRQRLDWDFDVGTLEDTLTRALAVAHEAEAAKP